VGLDHERLRNVMQNGIPELKEQMGAALEP
jgi:hypothetical protein